MYRTKITRKSDKAFSFSDFNIQNTSTAPLYTLEIEYPDVEYSIRTYDFLSYVGAYIKDLVGFSAINYDDKSDSHTIMTDLVITDSDYVNANSVFTKLRTFLALSSAVYFEATAYIDLLDIDNSLTFYKHLNNVMLSKSITIKLEDLPEIVF